MGCCIRTGTHISLDLTDFTWKLIADEEVKTSDFDEMDTQFYAQIKQLTNCPSEEAFDAIDKDGSGVIEFKEWYKHYGIDFPQF